MLGQAVTIARNTFVESVRQPIYFILIALCGLAILLSTWGTGFAMGYSDTSEVSGDNKLLLDLGLATVFVSGMLLAAFIATAVISREIDRKTVLTVVSKPVARPVVVLGKYLGVAAAMVVAVTTMLLFLQLGIRHGVMSNASDTLDGPVVLFSLLAVVLSLGTAVWCNFFYGWSFTQTATLLMLPLFALAFLGVLLVDKKWHVQSIAADFKPQVTLASIAVLMSTLVLSALATAASARLGQVMTIVVCAGMFMLGLLSNHLVGRHAFRNEYVGRIEHAMPLREVDADLSEPGAGYEIMLKNDARRTIRPGDSFYFAATPSGFPMLVRSFPRFEWDLADRDSLYTSARPPSLVITDVSGRKLTVRRIGGPGPLLEREGLGGPPRPPRRGDFVFLGPTGVNPAALAVWGIIPNVQFFWLTDAVTQSQDIPVRHVGLLALYAVAQIGLCLSVAVLLFQRREVG